MLVTMEDQLRSGRGDDLAERRAVDERVFGLGEAVDGRMVHQNDTRQPLFAQRREHATQTPELLGPTLAGGIERRGCHRARDPDERDVIEALHERVVTRFTLPVHVAAHVVLEALRPLGAPSVGVVIPRNDRDRDRDRLELLHAQLELGLERQVGQIAGHDEAIEREFLHLFDHAIEE